MMQVVFFLTEHVAEIQIAFYGVVVVLLLVTLHRIKQMVSWMQEHAKEEEKDVTPEDVIWDKPMVTQEEYEALHGGENDDREHRQDEEMAPEALLSEVLDEVFP